MTHDNATFAAVAGLVVAIGVGLYVSRPSDQTYRPSEQTTSAPVKASSAPSKATRLVDERNEGRNYIPVWKSEKAKTEGQKLRDLGYHKSHPQMIMQLVACLVKSGTKIVISDRTSWTTREVLVIDGEEEGCRGFVSIDFVKEGSRP